MKKWNDFNDENLKRIESVNEREDISDNQW